MPPVRRHRTEAQRQLEEELDRATDKSIYDPDQDASLRREVRKGYRQLLRAEVDNKTEYLKPGNNGLRDIVRSANVLFEQVRSTTDAALDSRLLVNTSDAARAKARKMKLGDSPFDVDEFLSKLITYGNGRIPNMNPNDDDNIRELDWNKIGLVSFRRGGRRPPTMDWMLGPLSLEKKVRERTERQRLRKDRADLVRPQAIGEGDIEQQENTTPQNVRAISDILAQHSPCPLFKFILNPESFPQTVENIFYLSFLVRDGKASIQEDEDGLPVVQDCEEPDEADFAAGLKKKQIIFEMTEAMWKELCEAFDVRKSIIPTRKAIEHNTGKWYG
ncbi:hypothetical protein YB2330_006506 [Saitoella coloradoensis]